MKLNLNLIKEYLTNLIKSVTTTSDNETYSCNYINDYINGQHYQQDELILNDIEIQNVGNTTGQCKSIAGYDYIVVVVRGDWNHCRSILIPATLSTYAYDCHLFQDSSYMFSGYINFTDNTHLKITKSGGSFGLAVFHIYGIKIK